MSRPRLTASITVGGTLVASSGRVGAGKFAGAGVRAGWRVVLERYGAVSHGRASWQALASAALSASGKASRFALTWTASVPKTVRRVILRVELVSHGRLLATTHSRRLEIRPPAIVAAKTISAGGFHTCALLVTATIDCWGDNEDGQLGDGTTSLGSDLPLAVSGRSRATQIAAGNAHTCALLVTASIDCWGYNYTGQLGDGTTTDSDLPVAVSGITNATQITAGSAHTCALLATGAVDCWGYDGAGELGDGITTFDSDLPVAVRRIG